MLENYSLQDLKVIYRTLSKSLATTPELLDSDFLQDLQSFLQKIATRKNYDVSLHADWENFINGKGPTLRSL